MFYRMLAIIGILFALFGVMIAPGIMTQMKRRRLHPIHSLHPDQGAVPWDLASWIPVGFIDRREAVERGEWKWMPKFRRVK